MRKTKSLRATRPSVAQKVAAPPFFPPWWQWAIPLAALLLVFEVYGPAIHGDFVFDERNLPFFSPHFNDQLSTWVAGVRPLLMLSFWIDYRLGGGLQPFWFHLSIFALFAALTLLLAFVVHRLLDGSEGKLTTMKYGEAREVFPRHRLARHRHPNPDARRAL